jgi:hypothetical protein
LSPLIAARQLLTTQRVPRRVLLPPPSRSETSSAPHLALAFVHKLLKMALIVDKHRPRSLDTLTYHEELSDRLRSLVSDSALTTHIR